MKYIKHIFFFIFFTLFATPDINSFEGFDFDQMQNLQQELEEANKVIEEYISSLPADEQAEFNRQVDEFSQMFENMSDEEFSSFLNEMFVDESMAMPMETFTPMPQEIPVEIPTLTTEQKKKVENIIKIIDDIIRQSNIFLVQVNSSLEAAKNINNWIRKGSIMDWQLNTTWEDFKKEIEKFVQQLYKLEDKDLATQEYKYILDLIEDESTLNNLIQLQTNLNATIPQIEISELDIKKLSSQAKTAMRDTLQYYTEAFYILQIPKALETLFEKFGPKAEKYRESEEAAEKRAAEAAKRPRVPVSATAAGVSAEAGYGYEPSYGGYDYGQPYGGYGYGGGYPTDFYGGGYGGGFGGFPGEEGFGGKERRGAGGEAGPRMGGGGGAGGGVAEKEAEKEKPGVPTGGPAQAPTKSPLIKELIKDIQTSIKDVAKIIDEDTLFSTIDEHVLGKENTDTVNIDLANEIADVNKKVKALEEEVQSLQSMMLKADKATQIYYNTRLNAYLEKPMEILTNFKTKLEKIDFTKINTRVTPEKQWAYFAGDDNLLKKIQRSDAQGDAKVKELQEKIPTRISLVELLKTINNFQATLKTFKEKTAQPAKKPTTTPQTIPTTPITPSPKPTPTQQ